MSRVAGLLAALLILVAPFGEGGRAPWALFTLQTLAILYMAMALPSARRVATDPRRRAAIGVSALVAGALLASAASTWRAAYPLAAGFGLLDLGIAGGLLLAATWSGGGARHLVLLRHVVVASTTLQAAIAAVRWTQGGVMQAGSGFLNPNHLAAFLNIGFFCAVAAAMHPGDRRPWWVLLWSALAVFHVAVVAALESRGALLGVLGGGIMLLALRWRDLGRRGRLVAGVTLVLFVLSGGWIVANRFARFDDPFRYHRLGIWKASLEMLAERPILGYGPGMFRYVSPQHNFPIDQGPVRYGRSFHGAHNGLLTLAVENGMLGATCLAAAALLALMVLLGPTRSGRASTAAQGFGLALLTLLVHGMVADLQERPALTMVMALAIGMALGARAAPWDGEGAAVGSPAAVPRGRPSGLVTSAAVMLAFFFWIGCIALPYVAHVEAEAGRAEGREGLESMRQAARLNPYHPDYQHALAMAALNSGPIDAEHYAEAADRLARARALKPIDYRFPLLLARVEDRFADVLFEDRGAAGRAADLYAEAVRLAPLDPRPALEQAAFLASRGRLEEGLAAVSAALRIEPHFRRARLMQIDLLLQLRRPKGLPEAWRALRATDEALRDYHPESTYAADLTRDAPEQRQRIVAIAPPPAAHRSDDASH
jgi:O-antigen ligase